jgi:guanylate kinase
LSEALPTTAREHGRLIVLAAPSGAGKTTLVRALLERNPDLRFSVSYTTRPKRRSEQQGRDYFFVDRPRFQAMVAAGEFLEYARVFDNWYGTGRVHVEALLEAGHCVLLEIDWQGAAQVRQTMPEAVSIFIMPPSRAELERRLRGRKTDSEAVIERRLADALADMSHWSEFDYLVINDDLDEAVTALQRLVSGDDPRYATTWPEVMARAQAVLATG